MRRFVGEPAAVTRQRGDGLPWWDHTRFAIGPINGHHPAVALDILLAKDSRFDGIRKGERRCFAMEALEEMGCEPLVHAESFRCRLRRPNMMVPLLPALHGQPLR
jgi:hypothetical protein